MHFSGRLTADQMLSEECVGRAILGSLIGQSEGQPARVDLSFKPFPWPAFTLDIGAASAALAFNLLLVFAFFVPTRSIVTTIVREKELHLREGMRIFGLQVIHITYNRS